LQKYTKRAINIIAIDPDIAPIIPEKELELLYICNPVLGSMVGDPEGDPEGEYETTELSERAPGGSVTVPFANTEPLGSCDCVCVCDEVPKKLPNRDGEAEAEAEPEEEPE